MSTVNVLIATALFSCALFTFSIATTEAQRLSNRSRDKVLAEAYASELTEFFRSMSAPALEAHLRINPVSGSAAIGDRYFYCAHINILNRFNRVMVNPDPLANLPSNRLDQGTDPALNANRWYLVQVVNRFNLEPDRSFCMERFGQRSIAADQTYLVTVGVTYFNRGEAVAPRSLTQVTWRNNPSVSNEVYHGGCAMRGCLPETGVGSANTLPVNRVVLSVILLKDLYDDYQ